MRNLMKVTAKLITLLLTATVFLATGCRTSVSTDPVIGKQDTAVYQAGYFYAYLEADADTVFRTSIRALDKMGILRTGEVHREEFVNIFGRKIGDQKITVRIRQIAPAKSEVRVRVGFIGNLPESQMIYTKIRDEL